jgi:hypothetical protein
MAKTPPQLPLNERYRWLPTAGKTGRYYDNATKRLTSWANVRNDIDKYIDSSNRAMDALATQLRNREISLAEWQTAMRNEIKAMHLNASMAAHGGRAQMTQADWGRAGRQIRTQYEYLDKFAQEIATGKQPLNGRVNVRAQLYGDAARGTLEQERRNVAARGGMTEERRLLHAKESCVDCMAYAGRGWQPIGTLPRIGDSRCNVNCKCTFEYR